jgi:hypothetical protein
MWDEAYNNTKAGGCKTCNTKEYEGTTREMQLLGNVYQRIVTCKCGDNFVEDMN